MACSGLMEMLRRLAEALTCQSEGESREKEQEEST